MRRRIPVFLSIALSLLLSGTLVFGVSIAEINDCDHKYTPSVIIAPTSTQTGETKNTCDLCGDYYIQITPATGHQWGEWVIDKEPTCALPGQKHRVCTATEVLHSEYAEIPPFGHDYMETTKEPSCTTAGMRTYTCNHCNHSYTQLFGNPTGHQYNVETTLPATKDKEGTDLYACELCGDSYTVPTPYHQYEVVGKIDANCEHDGKIVYVCKIYGDSYSESLPATGHQWGEWIIGERENLTNDGYKYRVCEYDISHMENQIIPAGITMEITPVAVAINIGNIILIVVSSIILFFEYSVLSWERKARKKRAELLGNGGAKK